VLCSLGILSNLTADNRTNKSLLVKLNGVQTLMQKLMTNADGNDDLIDAAVSLSDSSCIFYGLLF